MGRQYSRRLVYGLAPAILLLASAGCDDLRRSETMTQFREIAAPGGLGRLIDRPPPPVSVTEGGPSGVVIGGHGTLAVPETEVDLVIAPPLREWLTAPERRKLAAASETAAAAPTGAAIAWGASDGKDTKSAAGSATPIAEVYRSKRGAICRDVAQRVEKNAAQHTQTVTLCRDAQTEGPVLWLIVAAE
jgi:hypothetical protein